MKNEKVENVSETRNRLGFLDFFNIVMITGNDNDMNVNFYSTGGVFVEQ